MANWRNAGNDGVYGQTTTLLSDVSATGGGGLKVAPAQRISLECKVLHDTSGTVGCTVTVYGTNESSIPATAPNSYLAQFVLTGTDEARDAITIEHRFANIWGTVDAIDSASMGVTLTAGV